jgi:hypothetical protein
MGRGDVGGPGCLLRLAEGDADQGAALLRETADLLGQVGRPLDEACCLAYVA